MARPNLSVSNNRKPPGWPREVPPPGADAWEEKACSWLLDLSPGEYRSYEILRRHPQVLAWWAQRNVEAQLNAARQAYARARAEMQDQVPPEVLAELLSTLEQEGARLLGAQREIGLVTAALRGEHYIPRL